MPPKNKHSPQKPPTHERFVGRDGRTREAPILGPLGQVSGPRKITQLLVDLYRQSCPVYLMKTVCGVSLWVAVFCGLGGTVLPKVNRVCLGASFVSISGCSFYVH